MSITPSIQFIQVHVTVTKSCNVGIRLAHGVIIVMGPLCWYLLQNELVYHQDEEMIMSQYVNQWRQTLMCGAQ